MMKLRNLMQVACMATAALTAFSCSQEEFENSGRKGNITVNATFEGAGTDTRTTVNDEYKILWQDTDALGLFCSNAESNYSNLKSATTRLYDTEAKIICIVSKKGAQCIECHHKDI